MSLSESVWAPPQHAVFNGNVDRAGGAKQVVHEVRLGGRLAAGPLVLLRKDMSRPRVHAAVVIGDLQAVQGAFQSLLQSILAEAMHDPVERVNGLDLAGLVSGMAGLP
jgi:hypothetical protein